MQHSFHSPSVKADGGVGMEHEIQRPPYGSAYGNSFIQSLLQTSAPSLSNTPHSTSAFNGASNQARIDSLFLTQLNHGGEPMAEHHRNKLDGLLQLSQLPERLLLQLDENDSLPFGEQINRLLDHWFPIGHGYYTEGFLSADIEALHLGSKGTIRVQRLASDRFRVQSTHSNAIGAVGRLGGKSNLFGKNWETEVEGTASIIGTMTEVFEFPIQNPILLLPLMAVHGVFKTDLLSELLAQVSPHQYKSFRESVTYGMGTQLTGIAAYKSEHPQLTDLAMAFGIQSASMCELTLFKHSPNGIQDFELTLSQANGVTAELTCLIYNELGIPKQVLDESGELGAKLKGQWEPQKGQSSIGLNHFSLIGARNPTLDTVQDRDTSTQLELEYDSPPSQLMSEGTRWPERLKVTLSRSLDMGLGIDWITPDIQNGFEEMGININSQALLKLELVIPKSTMQRIWHQVKFAFEHIDEFFKVLLQNLTSPTQDSRLSNRCLMGFMDGCQLTKAMIRCSHQGEADAAFKVGLGSGAGIESSGTLGKYFEMDLCDTPLEASIKESVLGRGVGLC